MSKNESVHAYGGYRRCFCMRDLSPFFWCYKCDKRLCSKCVIKVKEFASDIMRDLVEYYCPVCYMIYAQRKGYTKWYNLKYKKAKRIFHACMPGMKFCPKCGSTNIRFPISYRSSIWKCLDCGYTWSLIVENGKLE